MPTIDTGMEFCPRCAVERPRAACRASQLGTEPVLLCPVCGIVTRAVTTRVREPLLTVFLTAARYPFQKDGWIALLALSFGAWVAAFLPLVGALLAGGLQLTYLFSIVRSTAKGDDDLPGAVDFTEWSDLLRPMVRSLLASLVAFLPVILSLAFLRESSSLPVALGASALWAAAYLPGALAVASFQDGCLGGANPIPVIEIARRVPKEYALTVGVLAALAVPAQLIRVLAAMAVPPVLGLSAIVTILGGAVALIVPFMMARVLGLLLRERGDELGIND